MMGEEINYPNEIKEDTDEIFDDYGIEEKDDDRDLGCKTSDSRYYEENTEPNLDVITSGRTYYLNKALKCYLHASQLDGYIKKLENDHSKNNSEKIKENIEKRDISNFTGDNNFAIAFGSFELMLGGFNPDDVDKYQEKSSNEFKDKYVGVRNKKNRKKFRKVLKKSLRP